MLKTIWEVSVHLTEHRGYDTFFIEAKDDTEARDKGIQVMSQNWENFNIVDDVLYVELSHHLNFHEL